MPKILIIITHPDLENSIVNKRWIQELVKYPDLYDIHDLHSVYPDEKIDIKAEQRLVAQYDKIVFQFPFYWFNCPPLLKKWLDEVLSYGWAYGSQSGYKMKNKKVALAISLGISEEEYKSTGKYKYTLEQLTVPFEITFCYIKSNYISPFAHYGIEKDNANDVVDESAIRYIKFLEKL